MGRGILVEQVKSTGRAPLRASIFTNRRGLALYKPSVRNRIIRTAFTRAGNNWRAKFLKIRFTKKVLSAPFNYKGDPFTPLIGTHTGSAKSANAAFKGKIRTSKNQGGGDKFVMRIPLPLGHPVNEEIIRVLRTVPAAEVAWLGNDAADGIRSIMDSGTEQQKQHTRRPKTNQARRGNKPRGRARRR